MTTPSDLGDFLAALARADADALMAMGRTRRLRAGDAVLHEGATSDVVVVVTRGRLKLSNLDTNGREAVLAIVGPGNILGELSAIDGEPHAASAIALEATEAMIITGEQFREFVAQRPSVALALLRTITRRLRDADRRQAEFGTQDSVGRIAARLVDLADRYGERDGHCIRITVPISQDELASMTGCSREAVVKALRTLRSRHWIETGRRSFRIIDRDALVHRSS
jgi:CRP-like cAMP-binding protein